jgi:hypothetical protein
MASNHNPLSSASQVVRVTGLQMIFSHTRSYNVAQADLELMIFLPQPPEYWDYRYAQMKKCFNLPYWQRYKNLITYCTDGNIGNNLPLLILPL